MFKKLAALSGLVFLLVGCDSSANKTYKVKIHEASCEALPMAPAPSTVESVANSALGAVGGYFLGGMVSKDIAGMGAALGGSIGLSSGAPVQKYACQSSFYYEGKLYTRSTVSENFYLKYQIITLYHREMQELLDTYSGDF